MTLSSDNTGDAREARRRAFLAEAGLADARRAPLPGDASTRRYERLTTPSGTTLMLMDQAPSAESPPADPSWDAARRRAEGWNATARLSAGRIEAFAAVAAHLKGLGLSAPEIVALDPEGGLAVLEDFGEAVFAQVIAEGADARELYFAAIEALARLHEAGPPPEVLNGPGGPWPVQDYDALALQTGADLFVEWLPKLKPGLAFDAAAIQAWRAAWRPVVKAGAAGASVMAHRDYHAENLIWLPARTGSARAGMIDFQDAVRAHPSWDLHSLLQDARRDVAPELEAAALDHYFALRPEADREAFKAAYAGLAALNEARILGVFARLIVRDGKPRYAAFMPRMWAHLRRNLAAPGLEPVAAWFAEHAPGELQG
ncbi:MAG: N-acetylmuramate/N-acetylglucosamine kinase AmgK [Brevundimonas sp.]